MPAPIREQIWLWTGTTGMLLGMLYFIVLEWSVKNNHRQKFDIVTIFVITTVFINYLFISIEFVLAIVTVGGGQMPIYWARYTDWFFTIPLLLIDLGLLVGANWTQLTTLVGVDMLMIGTGALATLSSGSGFLSADAHRLIWWGISTGFLLVLLYILCRTLEEESQRLSSDTKSTFETLRTLLIIVWLIYPIWWLFGTEGLGTVSLYIETAGFTVLDLIAKVGIGLIFCRAMTCLMRQLKQSKQVHSPPTHTSNISRQECRQLSALSTTSFQCTNKTVYSTMPNYDSTDSHTHQKQICRILASTSRHLIGIITGKARSVSTTFQPDKTEGSDPDISSRDTQLTDSSLVLRRVIDTHRTEQSLLASLQTVFRADDFDESDIAAFATRVNICFSHESSVESCERLPSSDATTYSERSPPTSSQKPSFLFRMCCRGAYRTKPVVAFSKSSHLRRCLFSWMRGFKTTPLNTMRSPPVGT